MVLNGITKNLFKYNAAEHVEVDSRITHLSLRFDALNHLVVMQMALC